MDEFRLPCTYHASVEYASEHPNTSTWWARLAEAIASKLAEKKGAKINTVMYNEDE